MPEAKQDIIIMEHLGKTGRQVRLTRRTVTGLEPSPTRVTCRYTDAAGQKQVEFGDFVLDRAPFRYVYPDEPGYESKAPPMESLLEDFSRAGILAGKGGINLAHAYVPLERSESANN